MKLSKIICIIGILILYSGNYSAAPGKDNNFPRVGFIKNDNVNVRAGDNINFESLCKLKKGDPVKVIGKRYSWLKIILPRKAYLYIKSDYVDLDTDNMHGTVSADRVNLRAGPGTKYSILGQVSKPDKLTVLSEAEGWYKVEPPEGTTGWIHSSQIRFVSEEGSE